MDIGRRAFFLASLGISIGTAVYARMFESEWLEVSRESISLANKPLSQSLRLLHLSDLHAGRDVPYEFIEEAINAGLAENPDLVCITGDFITSDIPDPERYKRILRKLSDRCPTYASFGNHDGGSWAGRRGGYPTILQMDQLLKDSGITTLLNADTVFKKDKTKLRIVGLGDLWAKSLQPEAIKSIAPQTGKGKVPTVLLSHNPDSKDALRDYRWNLMLSGHTHGGQFRLPVIGAPFAPVRDLRYVEGLHKWEDRWLYISRGVGNIYGLRINCRPQVTILNLF